MAAAKKILDADGLRYLIQQLVTMMEQHIDVRLVSDIDESSTSTEIPTALSVYNFVLGVIGDIAGVRFEVVDDELPEVGEGNVIYLKKAEESATAYTMYIYYNDEWTELGLASLNLDNYWSFDDLSPMTNSEIQGIIDEIIGEE